MAKKHNKPAEKSQEQRLEDQLLSLSKNIEISNRFYKQKNVIARSLTTGVFTALGATIGFALVILVLTSFVRTISAVPFIKDVLEQTGINKIIEYQLQQIDKGTASPTPTVTPT